MEELKDLLKYASNKIGIKIYFSDYWYKEDYPRFGEKIK